MDKMIVYSILLGTSLYLCACSQDTTTHGGQSGNHLTAESHLPPPAHTSSPTSPPRKATTSTGTPCENLRTACEDAGFSPGDGKDAAKDIWKNCVSLLLKGQIVPGVKFNPADVAACKAKRAAIQNPGDLTAAEIKS